MNLPQDHDQQDKFWNNTFRKTTYFHTLSSYGIIQHYTTSAVGKELFKWMKNWWNIKNFNQYNQYPGWNLHQVPTRHEANGTKITFMFNISFLRNISLQYTRFTHIWRRKRNETIYAWLSKRIYGKLYLIITQKICYSKLTFERIFFNIRFNKIYSTKV